MGKFTSIKAQSKNIPTNTNNLQRSISSYSYPLFYVKNNNLSF